MAISPLQFFSVGREIGRARSPASTPANMIRSVLDTAQKHGLLAAQSSFQSQGAADLAGLKVGLERQFENEPIPAYFVSNEGQTVPIQGPIDPATGQPGPITRGTKFIQERSSSGFADFMDPRYRASIEEEERRQKGESSPSGILGRKGLPRANIGGTRDPINDELLRILEEFNVRQ